MRLSLKEKHRITIQGAKAPSGGNIQPWHVSWKGDEMFVHLDSKRKQSFLDVGSSASIFSIGSFVENIVQTSEIMKIQVEIILSEKISDDALIAQLKFSKQTKKKSTNILGGYIDERTTNRKFYDGRLISSAEISEIMDMPHMFKGVSLRTEFLNSKKKEISEIVGEGDIIRTIHDKLFSQMMLEIRWNDMEAELSRDGLDIKTLELPKYVARMLNLISKDLKIRKLFPRNVYGENAKVMINGSSHVGCICIDDKESLFNAGRVLEYVWLKATAKEIYIQPWTVLTFMWLRLSQNKGQGFNEDEVRMLDSLELRFKKVFSIKKESTPIFIFRIFKSKPPSRKSLRRSLSDYCKALT